MISAGNPVVSGSFWVLLALEMLCFSFFVHFRFITWFASCLVRTYKSIPFVQTHDYYSSEKIRLENVPSVVQQRLGLNIQTAVRGPNAAREGIQSDPHRYSHTPIFLAKCFMNLYSLAHSRPIENALQMPGNKRYNFGAVVHLFISPFQLTSPLSSAGFLLGLLFDPEDGSSMFLRNVGQYNPKIILFCRQMFLLL